MNVPHERSPAGAHKQDDPAPVCAPLSAAAGWKLVPMEPTPEMIAAMAVVNATAREVIDGRTVHCIGMAGAVEAFEEMLAAAPCAPTSAGTENDPAQLQATFSARAQRFAVDCAALASPAGTAQPTSAAAAGVQPVADEAQLPFSQWPKLATDAFDALEKHLMQGPSFPLGLLYQIRVGLAGRLVEDATPPTPASEAVVQDAARLAHEVDLVLSDPDSSLSEGAQRALKYVQAALRNTQGERNGE